MRALIAVITCQRFRHRANAQRYTWLPYVRDADVRFFIGGGDKKNEDEVLLDVKDDYESLPYKSQAAFRWALDRGYDYVFKTDDDVYLEPSRLLSSGFENTDYSGPLSTGPSLVPYASGFAYWLSRKAMEVLIDKTVDDDAEDRWTGNALAAAQVELHADDRYVVVNQLNERNPISGTEGPRLGNRIIAACEFDPVAMWRIHQERCSKLSEVIHGSESQTSACGQRPGTSGS